MAIPAVKPGGWGPLMIPRSSELAAIDEALATRGTDSVNGDTITGKLSLQTDVNTPTTVAYIKTAAGAGITMQGLESKVLTQTGGRLELDDGDFPEYPSGQYRTRVVNISMLEAMRATGSGVEYFAYDAPGISSNANTGVDTISTAIRVPITRPHDGAVTVSITLFFFLRQQPGSLPSQLPNLQLWTVPFSTLSTPTELANATFAAGSEAAYYNNGAVNALTVSVSGSPVMDVQSNEYVALVSDDNGSHPCRPVFTALQVTFGSITSEAFQQ